MMLGASSQSSGYRLSTMEQTVVGLNPGLASRQLENSHLHPAPFLNNEKNEAGKGEEWDLPFVCVPKIKLVTKYGR